MLEIVCVKVIWVIEQEALNLVDSQNKMQHPAFTDRQKKFTKQMQEHGFGPFSFERAVWTSCLMHGFSRHCDGRGINTYLPCFVDTTRHWLMPTWTVRCNTTLR